MIRERLATGGLRAVRRAGVHIPMLRTAASLVLMSCITAPAWAAGTFYVDRNNPNASDTGPGTEAIPYKTIQAACNARGGPGTTINVKTGTYREQVTIDDSGTAGNPYVIKAITKPVLIDGSDDYSTTGQWAAGPNGSFLAASVTWSPRQVFADGARLDSSGVSAGSLPVNSFTWVAGTGLYVKLAGNANPGDHAAKVGRRAHGFRFNGRNYVTVDGFQVARTEDHGMYALVCSNLTLRNNTVIFAEAHGLALLGGSNNLVELSTFTDNGDHGINLLNGVTATIVQDNESARNARRVVRAANGIMLFGSSNNVIQRNRFHDNEDSGVEVTNGSANNRFIQNRSWNNGDHGFDHIDAQGTVHINDLAYHNVNDGISVEGGSTSTQVWNTILVENGLGTGRFDLFADSSSTAGFTSNFNLIWNSTVQKPIKYNGVQYATVLAYSQASGKDVNSEQSDPRFKNAATGDFHLTSGSKAIDSAHSGAPFWPLKDAENRSRIDDPGTTNSGMGPITYADRGPLEFNRSGSVAVDDPTVAHVSLGPAFPNPAQAFVSFSIELAQGGDVSWFVSDIQGRIVYEDRATWSAGRGTIRWNGLTRQGRRVATGMYTLRVKMNEESMARTFAILR